MVSWRRRFLAAVQRRSGDPLSAAAGARLASLLFVLCGALAGVVSLLPVPDGVDRWALAAIGAVAVAFGVFTWYLPWERWHRTASLWIEEPAALALVAAHNVITGADGYRYGLFFLVSFAWVGLVHPQWTALKFAPAMAASYLAPLLLVGDVEASAVSSLAYALPTAVLIGETTALVAGRLRASEAARSAGEARWRSLVMNASDLILVLAADGEITYCTPAVERLFGYPEDSVVGLQVLDHIHPEDLGFVIDRLTLALDREGPGELIEFRVTRANGESVWVEALGTNLLDEPSVRGIVCNVRDITERKEAEAELVYRARHDVLTELPNRLSLVETVGSWAGAGDAPFALLLLDLDRFKEINDGLGHETGDRLLVQVARRLEATIEDGDFIARLGGDEFAIVVRGEGTVEAAIAVAARLLGAIDRPFDVDGMALHVGGSIGIASFDPALDASDDVVMLLLQRADVAMYRAKDHGAGWSVHEAEDDEDRPARLALANALRDAIDAGDIVAHYQPQLDLVTGRVEKVEVLARWTRDGVAVSPEVFIPVAEHTGLIGRLTDEMLDQALAQCRAWRDAGRRMAVAVNVSALSLRDPKFVDRVRGALTASGVEPALLTLEITESALAEQTMSAIAVMQELRAIGVRLAIDDFGSGYSSMAYLKRMPIDELKIDRAFVTDMLTDVRDQPITRAIIELGRSLDLKVVGEGVESAAIEDLLRGFGCHAVQGYSVCRPLPAADLAAWLAGATTLDVLCTSVRAEAG